MPDSFDEFLSQRPATPERPLMGHTVLVVEDSRFACEALRLLCQRSGARIRRADSLRSARRHLQAFRPSVVIIDIGLPDGSGVDLIRDLAGAKPRMGAIIGMSGDDGASERAIAAGADAFLAKPIATVGQFQSVILSVVPTPPGLLRSVSNETVSPDRLAVRDDLARLAKTLEGTADGEVVDYAAQFLGGLARSAEDVELAAACSALADARADGAAGAFELERVATLLRERLGQNDAFAA